MSEQAGATAEQKPNPFRDAAGRFNKGNPGGPGNPFARFSAQMRKAFAEEATADDLREVARALIDKAKEGDVSAAKVVLSYTLGKPLEGVDPDRVDELECVQWMRENLNGEQAGKLMSGMNAVMLVQVFRALMPILSQCNWQSIADGLNAAVERDREDAEEAAREQVEEEAAKEHEAQPEPQGRAPEPASGTEQSRREAARKAREILGEGQILPIRPVADIRGCNEFFRAARTPRRAPKARGLSGNRCGRHGQERGSSPAIKLGSGCPARPRR